MADAPTIHTIVLPDKTYAEELRDRYDALVADEATDLESHLASLERQVAKASRPLVGALLPVVPAVVLATSTAIGGRVGLALGVLLAGLLLGADVFVARRRDAARFTQMLRNARQHRSGLVETAVADALRVGPEQADRKLRAHLSGRLPA